MGGRVPLGYEKDERTLRINEAEGRNGPDALCTVPEARNAPAGEGRGGPSETAHQATLRRGWNPDRRAAVSSRTPPLPADQSSLRRPHPGTRGVSTRASIHRSLLRNSGTRSRRSCRQGLPNQGDATTKGRAARSPLAGKLFDETGDRLTPSHTKKKTGQRLRYYVSRRLIQHSGQKDLSGWRLPAPMLEQTVVHLIRQHVDATTFSASLTHTPTMQELTAVRRFLDGLCSVSNDDNDPAARLLRLIRRVDISPGSMSILLDRNAFAACLSMEPDRIREDALRIHAPFRLRRRGVETKLALGNPTKSVDRTLLRNIANALSWLDRIKAGKTYEQIATEDAIPTDRVRKAIRYAFLAPDIVRAIVDGRQPVGLTSSYLLHHPLSDDWEKQRALIATL